MRYYRSEAFQGELQVVKNGDDDRYLYLVVNREDERFRNIHNVAVSCHNHARDFEWKLLQAGLPERVNLEPQSLTLLPVYLVCGIHVRVLKNWVIYRRRHIVGP